MIGVVWSEAFSAVLAVVANSMEVVQAVLAFVLVLHLLVVWRETLLPRATRDLASGDEFSKRSRRPCARTSLLMAFAKQHAVKQHPVVAGLPQPYLQMAMAY